MRVLKAGPLVWITSCFTILFVVTFSLEKVPYLAAQYALIIDGQGMCKVARPEVTIDVPVDTPRGLDTIWYVYKADKYAGYITKAGVFVSVQEQGDVSKEAELGRVMKAMKAYYIYATLETVFGSLAVFGVIVWSGGQVVGILRRKHLQKDSIDTVKAAP